MVYFISPLAGIGIVALVRKVNIAIIKNALLLALTVCLGIYWVISYSNAQRFNRLWANSSKALSYLSTHVSSGDKILAESGGTAILSSYNKNFPTNTTTFDWFVYHKETGEKAYLDAVKDGYFDIIELEGLGQQDGAIFSRLHNKVYADLTGNYTKIYANNGFIIFKRSF